MADAHEIIPRLWLGNRRAAVNMEWLQTNNINVVVNCSRDIPFSDDTYVVGRRIYRIPIDDSLREKDINYLTTASEEVALTLLREYKSGARILVHCAAGMQRSAATVAIFLMTLNHWSAEKAVVYIRSIREIAFRPGINFLPSIQEYERRLFTEILPAVGFKHT
jgi:atypical dual specificity phosphatase